MEGSCAWVAVAAVGTVLAFVSFVTLVPHHILASSFARLFLFGAGSIVGYASFVRYHLVSFVFWD